MYKLLLFATFAIATLTAHAQESTLDIVTILHSDLEGIGSEAGVMRRDPSDIIKVGDVFYVWYSKGAIRPGYDATVWYATSEDGHKWTENGMALDKGETGSWEGASVFTPNILFAEEKYWLFYTGTSKEFIEGKYNPDSKIGIATADSPDGPWERLASNPAVKNSDNVADFDSQLVDDACLLVKDGKYFCYYKGRQLGKSPNQTQMGLAISDKPEGPYTRYEGNPVISGNHEVLAWPQGTGVAAMIGEIGTKQITNSILYSQDGYHFTKTHNVEHGPWAGGTYRPEAFTDSGKGELPKWGVEIGHGIGKAELPCIQRFDVQPPANLSSMESAPETSQTNLTAKTAVANSRSVSIQVQAAQEHKAVKTTSVTFTDDLIFMKKHTPIVLLKDGDAAVAIAPNYQGRVMTSTFDDRSGPSFGWINRPVIEKGFLSDEDRNGKLEEHIYIFGGEERFWLGPEGGQFAIFFKPGSKFEFSDWTTPPAIDTEAFELVEKTDTSAKFQHSAELVNFTGTKFKVGIERTVKLINKQDAAKLLKVKLPAGIQMVGYETDNQITNIGTDAWTPETGLLSIWMLGMYNPSPETTVVIPFKEGGEETLGPKVNDDYFGKVPQEYLQVQEQKLFFKGDGTRRGKIGINAQRSKGIAGSYDAAGKVLNIVTYNVQDSPNGYVNSKWELQNKPFAGDVINSYNDGSPEAGKPPLGPFYELETSSPAAALKPGETLKHVQRTFHIQGTEEELNPLAVELLGTSLTAIKDAF